MRQMLAGLAAAVVIFIWGAIAHMALPLGSMGIQVAPNEGQLLLALKQTIPKAGMYMAPGLDHDREISEEEEEAWAEKYRQGPTALLIFNPYGSEPMSNDRFLYQFLSQLACGLLAAFVVARIRTTKAARILTVLLMGLFAWFSVQVPMWIWYEFPGAYALGQLIYLAVGWLLAGVAIERILKSEGQPGVA